MTKKEDIKKYYKQKYASNKTNIAWKSGDRSLQAFDNCQRVRGKLGCTHKEFNEKMEKHFEFMGYGWYNYGEWEVDHIKPLCQGGEHKLDNLQPLWLSDNRSKNTNNVS